MERNQTESRDPRTGKFLPGNRYAERHGAFSIVSGKVPRIRGIRQLKRELEELRKRLEENIQDLNPKKELLVNQVIRTETQIRLIELFLRKHGILRPDKYRKGILELHPSLASSYLSFLNVQKNALLNLGIDEVKAAEILDVRAYAKQKYGDTE